MAGEGIRRLAFVHAQPPRRALRHAASGRGGAYGCRLRRKLPLARERGLRHRMPYSHRLLRLQPRLPQNHPQDAATRTAYPAAGEPRACGAYLCRLGPVARETVCRGGGPRVDRTPVAAHNATVRVVRAAGRDGPLRRGRQLRYAIYPQRLRRLPPLSRRLPHGRHSRSHDHRCRAMRFVPHHRGRARQHDRPARLDLRLRRVPELLSL